ncbi:MAG: serine/threonine protein kinase [Candidatus Binataceae bacterium]
MDATVIEVLKLDSFGRVELVQTASGKQVRRVACGGKIPGSAVAARILARREQRLLRRLADVPGLPRALGSDEPGSFYRSYIDGVPLYEANAVNCGYFDQLFKLLDALHGACVTHNDLAKEANIIATPELTPALVDFQIALYFPPSSGRLRRRLFAMLRREDHRHLLKQKRVHRPDLLTAAEVQLLERKSLPVRLWSATLMKPYQRMLCWFGLEPARGPRGR